MAGDSAAAKPSPHNGSSNHNQFALFLFYIYIIFINIYKNMPLFGLNYSKAISLTLIEFRILKELKLNLTTLNELCRL